MVDAFPFFGICLGMQCAVVEFARNVLDIKNAASSEMDKSAQEPVIDMMHEQRKIKNKGGTMRLGSYNCQLSPDSRVYGAYQKEQIAERHRHRYEFNNVYKDRIESHGMMATGMNLEKNLVEIVEIKDHPWFIGVQFHPELKSTVEMPHPLFVDFIKHCMLYKNKAIN